ncbi:MAG: hypothetical protein RJA22_2290 [Verrucomicrobiota bacterium]|jgi:hypothetical protein
MLPARAQLQFVLLAIALLAAAAAPGAERTVEFQVKPGEPWQPGATRVLEDLAGFRAASVPLTPYGGRSDRRVKATGFFRVDKVGDRWWLVDPEGGLFLHTGLTSVAPKSKHGAKEAYARLYGSDARWAEAAAALLRGSGFNGVGAFSAPALLRATTNPPAYTVTLRLAADFGRRLGITHQQPGHTGYEGDCLPALHPDFPAFCAEACRGLGTNAADPWLVGYFSDNELPGEPRMLDTMLALDEARPALAPMRRAAWDWWWARRGAGAAPGDITAADRAAFLGHVFDTYLRVTTAAIRRADPHHLLFGPRFHGPLRAQRAVWEAAGRHLDAIAMNYYSTWTPRASDLANWAAWSGRPCLITEFYAKGADTPFPNRGGAGYIVRTQADRGAFYQNFTLALLESRTCVGWHWLRYIDNDPDDPSLDPSNRDSNKGVVTLRYEPYPALLARMRELNTNVHALVDFLDKQRGRAD